MKIETYLNAAMMAHQAVSMNMPTSKAYRRARQSFVFRARILRTVAIYRNFAEANGYREDQAWFWTDEWQAQEREVDKEIT